MTMPHRLFIALARRSIQVMQRAGLNDTMIADILIETRTAAIQEERLRIEILTREHPPQLGLTVAEMRKEISGE